jgi:hypothetical protein
MLVVSFHGNLEIIEKNNRKQTYYSSFIRVKLKQESICRKVTQLFLLFKEEERNWNRRERYQRITVKLDWIKIQNLNVHKTLWGMNKMHKMLDKKPQFFKLILNIISCQI